MTQYRHVFADEGSVVAVVAVVIAANSMGRSTVRLSSVLVTTQDVAAIRPDLDAWRESANDYDEVVLDTRLSYLPGRPVRVHVRKRGGRYDLTDAATAVNLACRPDGWLTTASDTVATLGMNVNRRGVVFVTGFERRRDLADLALRLAECSRLVYQSLLGSAD